MQQKSYNFSDLIKMMKYLRSEKGCPWDKDQDYLSLRKYLLEETYEVLEAIDLNDEKKMCEELGDLVMQVVFYAQIASEKSSFDINDVVNAICHKMINRHSHVFGNDKAETPEDVFKNWNAIKNREKGPRDNISILKDVPVTLPALMRSYKVQQKAELLGLTQNTQEELSGRIIYMVQELMSAVKQKDKIGITDQIGDVLFELINLSRIFKIEPEIVLIEKTNKFIMTFEKCPENGGEI
jgi:tetrapyrrole methylase family protein/MazG family protein